MLSDFTLGPSFNVKQGQPNLKVLNNSLIIGLRGLQCETNLLNVMGWESSDVVRFSFRPLLQGQTRTAKIKSAYNSLIIGPRGSQCENNLWEIMGWESSGVVRFDLRSNDDSLALASCLSGGYKFVSVR